MAMERMLGGLSNRRYLVGLEPVGEEVEEEAKSTSKSAVSRRIVAMTETALADLLAGDLSELDLALMIDGMYFAEHLWALGIDIDGTKHPLGLVEGSTEYATVVTELLTGPRERGLGTTTPTPPSRPRPCSRRSRGSWTSLTPGPPAASARACTRRSRCSASTCRPRWPERSNPIESMICISRERSRNVKRWRDGQMALRWCAAGMVEGSK